MLSGNHKLAIQAKLCFPEHVRAGLMQEWAHQDLNLEPADYESDALTN